MFELRVNKDAHLSGLSRAARSSQKLPQNQRRLAFLLVDGIVVSSLKADDVRTAFRACPIWEAGVINKVHVKKHPEVKISGGRLAPLPPDHPVFVLDKIPFEGYNLDGTEITGKQAKQQKKGGEASGSK